MKITIRDLGVLKWAEFELGDLTIICGSNNTGKTYATYALFGFLANWQNNVEVQVPRSQISALLNKGVTRIAIAPYVERTREIVDGGCQTYSKNLSKIFASRPVHFRNSEFRVDLRPEEASAAASLSFDQQIESRKGGLLSLTKEEGEMVMVVTLLANAEKTELPPAMIRQVISRAIGDVVFGAVFPRPFIASAERTGVAIFRKDLNIARNRLLDEIVRTGKEFDPMKLVFRTYLDYALPVKTDAVEFARRLEDVAKEESFLSKQHPGVLEDFSDIVGGEYTIESSDTVYFMPAGSRRKLAMEESSSAVRSLLDVGFYVRHVAKPGDLLMVDEPELNLHPENQRRVARLFARLINLGIRVFVTTHSDYIVKELNTLIMLNNDRPGLRRLVEQEGYRADELLDDRRVRVYMAEKAPIGDNGGSGTTKSNTLVETRVDPEMGIEARSFDETINKMNEIQEAIVWGEDE